MDCDQIRNRIRENLVELTDNDALTITDKTVAADVAGWDSVCHIKLMFALENDFDIHFEVSELSAPENVGALIDVIQSKIAAR